LDMMLDLETLGHKENAVIIQIGACYFNGDEFFEEIDARSSIAAGFEMTVETVGWWMEQEARPNIMNGINVQNAINKFNRFASKATRVWCHVSFDCPIIINHLNKFIAKPSIHYTQFRDLRTLVDLAGLNLNDYERVGTHHNALDDCLFQIQYCVDGLKKIKI